MSWGQTLNDPKPDYAQHKHILWAGSRTFCSSKQRNVAPVNVNEQRDVSVSETRCHVPELFGVLPNGIEK